MINPAEINKNNQNRCCLLLGMERAPCVFQLKKKKRRQKSWNTFFLMPSISPELKATVQWETRRWGELRSWRPPLIGSWGWLDTSEGDGKDPIGLHGTMCVCVTLPVKCVKISQVSMCISTSQWTKVSKNTSGGWRLIGVEGNTVRRRRKNSQKRGWSSEKQLGGLTGRWQLKIKDQKQQNKS